MVYFRGFSIFSLSFLIAQLVRERTSVPPISNPSTIHRKLIVISTRSRLAISKTTAATKISVSLSP
jgi:hypothetical protein